MTIQRAARRWPWSLVAAISLTTACKPEPLPPIDEKQVARMEEMIRELAPAEKFAPGARAGIAAKVLSEAETNRLPARMVKALGEVQGSGIEPIQKMSILYGSIDDELWEKACKDAKVRERISGESVPMNEKTQKTYEQCDFARFKLVTSEEASAANAGALAMAFTVYDHLERHRSLGEAEKTLLALLVKDSADWR